MRGKLNRELGMNTGTLIHKMSNQQGRAAQHRRLYSIFCGNLYAKRL